MPRIKLKQVYQISRTTISYAFTAFMRAASYGNKRSIVKNPKEKNRMRTASFPGRPYQQVQGVIKLLHYIMKESAMRRR